MKYVHLTNNIVDFEMEAHPSNVFGEPYVSEFIEAEDNVTTGWKYINGVFEAPEIIIQVPQTITKLQAMKQLKTIGKWEALKAILASNEDINDEWLLSDNLNRSYLLVLQMAQALNLTDEEVDTLFIEASKL